MLLINVYPTHKNFISADKYRYLRLDTYVFGSWVRVRECSKITLQLEENEKTMLKISGVDSFVRGQGETGGIASLEFQNCPQIFPFLAQFIRYLLILPPPQKILNTNLSSTLAILAQPLCEGLYEVQPLNSSTSIQKRQHDSFQAV